jgi:hypothetical protein
MLSRCRYFAAPFIDYFSLSLARCSSLSSVDLSASFVLLCYGCCRFIRNIFLMLRRKTPLLCDCRKSFRHQCICSNLHAEQGWIQGFFKGGFHFYFWFSKGERFHSRNALSLTYFSKIFWQKGCVCPPPPWIRQYISCMCHSGY